MKSNTEYLNLNFLWIGGSWGYASMKIRDDKGVVKIRLAKCKRKGEFPRTEKFIWEEVNPTEISNLNQVQKINFKRLKEFEYIIDRVKEDLNSIENSNQDE